MYIFYSNFTRLKPFDLDYLVPWVLIIFPFPAQSNSNLESMMSFSEAKQSRKYSEFRTNKSSFAIFVIHFPFGVARFYTLFTGGFCNVSHPLF